MSSIPIVTVAFCKVPPAQQAAISLATPVTRGNAPAAQLVLNANQPIRVFGMRAVPTAGATVLAGTAPRVLPGRLIKPTSGNRLLTSSTSTISVGGADYFGLAVWTAHTFANGEQCRTGPWSTDFSRDIGPLGNAYQCSQAGISTIAPTGTGTNISMGSDGARFNYLGTV